MTANQDQPLSPEQKWELAGPNANIDELVRVWAEAIDAFAALAAQCTPEQWHLASPCPGWDVADVVAHTIGLEREFHGDPMPDHTPDWSKLPHAKGPFEQYTEVTVDYRRGRTQQDLLTELAETIEMRKKDLAGISSDPNEMAAGPAGFEMPRAQMLQTRILDIWIHEQDIRVAIGSADGYDSDAAWVTAARLSLGLPKMWGKTLGAQIGQTLRVEVLGPGVEFTKTITINDEGRAEVVSNGHWDMTLEGQPTAGNVLLRATFPAYVELAAGREGTAALIERGDVLVVGDSTLTEKLVPAMAITP